VTATAGERGQLYCACCS